MASAVAARPINFTELGFFFGLQVDAKKNGAFKKSTKFKGIKKQQIRKTEAETTPLPKSLLYPRFRDSTVEPNAEEQDDPFDTILCKHCKKTVLRRTSKDHIAGCLKSKQEKARKKKEAREAAQRAKERAERGDDDDDDDDDIKDGKRGKLTGDDAKSKKRKAEGDDDSKPNKKKRKEEPKAKGAKPKGPVDVERQCGVTLPNGQQCARSLTCKSHSMGAKRAVPGRSLPYDMLLAAYQKKNQARQQKAAIDATAAAFYDDDLDLAGPVDSDEERDAVMTAISRSLAGPQPIVTRTLFPTRRKYQLVRMKEMLSNALGGNRGGGLFSVPSDNPRSAYPASAVNETFVIPSATPLTAGGSVNQHTFRPPSRKESIDV